MYSCAMWAPECSAFGMITSLGGREIFEEEVNKYFILGSEIYLIFDKIRFSASCCMITQGGEKQTGGSREENRLKLVLKW